MSLSPSPEPPIAVLQDFEKACQYLSQPVPPADTTDLRNFLQTLEPELFLYSAWPYFRPWARKFLLGHLRLDELRVYDKSGQTLPSYCYTHSRFAAIYDNPTASLDLITKAYVSTPLLESLQDITPAMTRKLIAARPAMADFSLLPSHMGTPKGTIRLDVQELVCAYLVTQLPDTLERFEWHATRELRFVIPDLPTLLTDPRVIDAIVLSTLPASLHPALVTQLASALSVRPVHISTTHRARLLSLVPQLAEPLIKALSTPPSTTHLPSLPSHQPRVAPALQGLPPVRRLMDLPTDVAATALSRCSAQSALHVIATALDTLNWSDHEAIIALARLNIPDSSSSLPPISGLHWRLQNAIADNITMALTIPPSSVVSPVILDSLFAMAATTPHTLPFSSDAPADMIILYERHVAACPLPELRALGRSPYIISPLLANPLYPALPVGTILRRVPPECWAQLTMPIPASIRLAAFRHWFSIEPIASIRAMRKKIVPYNWDMLERNPLIRTVLLAHAMEEDPNPERPYWYRPTA